MNIVEQGEEKKTSLKKEATDHFYFERIAQQFLVENANIINHKNMRYEYCATHYRPLPDWRLCNMLRQWMSEKRIAKNNNVVGNIVPEIYQKSDLTYQDPKFHEKKMPFYLGDSLPFSATNNVISYENGILDIERYLQGDNTLIDHDPRWISAFCLPYAFDPGSDCPVWLNFLVQVYEGEEDQIALLQEYLGYCLTPDMSQHKVLFMVGVPRSGKGTIQHIASKLVGDANSTAFKLTALATTFGSSILLNKLLATVGEVNIHDHEKRTQIYDGLNTIVGQDAFQAERKHKDAATEDLTVRFLIACNELPKFHDNSGALSERLMFLSHHISFSGREDRQLREKLLSEISGISNWALRGLARLRRHGRFTEPKAMADTMRNFAIQSAPKREFIKECLMVERRIDPKNLGTAQIVDQPLLTPKENIYQL